MASVSFPGSRQTEKGFFYEQRAAIMNGLDGVCKIKQAQSPSAERFGRFRQYPERVPAKVGDYWRTGFWATFTVLENSAFVKSSLGSPARSVLVCLSLVCLLGACSPFGDRKVPRNRAFIAYWPPKEGDQKLRLAVKDLIDVKGVVTTAGSKYIAKTAAPACATRPASKARGGEMFKSCAPT